jgi:hypothetical protein
LKPVFYSISIALSLSSIDKIRIKPQKGPPLTYQVPPPPHVLFIDGNVKIQFIASLNLNYYECITGVKTIIEWSLSFWHEPRPRGRLKIILDEARFARPRVRIRGTEVLFARNLMARGFPTFPVGNLPITAETCSDARLVPLYDRCPTNSVIISP